MILIDTHVLLWWTDAEESRLNQAAHDRLAREEDSGEIFISTITTWEIALLVSHGKLRIGADLETWVRKIEVYANVRFKPIDNAIAIDANNLPGEFHRDPADRIIVATARVFDIELLTPDDKIMRYPHVKAIW